MSNKERPKSPVKILGQYEELQGVDLKIEEKDFKHFYKIFDDEGTSIPLHQELLTEVRSLLHSHRNRSTYLVLYTALEVATKNLIKTKKPDTSYLIGKMPSPDLVKLYDEYINKEIHFLADDNDKITLKKMSGIRNDIAHQGENVSLDVLTRHYDFVNKFVKKIESALGYD